MAAIAPLVNFFPLSPEFSELMNAAVVGFLVVGLCVVGLRTVALAVVGFKIVGLFVVPVVGFKVVGFAVVGFFVVGFAVVGLYVVVQPGNPSNIFAALDFTSIGIGVDQTFVAPSWTKVSGVVPQIYADNNFHTLSVYGQTNGGNATFFGG